MEDKKLLELGIEIVSAMQANCYDVDIETGRDFALSETEVDRMEGVDEEMWNDFTAEQKERFSKICKQEKERLHKQALYVAKITLDKLMTLQTSMKIYTTEYEGEVLADSNTKCVTGCKHFTGGEIKHHKDCPFYPDSMSQIYDKLMGFRDELITDFETDFVWDGAIVDEPANRYHLLPVWYRKAKGLF